MCEGVEWVLGTEDAEWMADEWGCKWVLDAGCWVETDVE